MKITQKIKHYFTWIQKTNRLKKGNSKIVIKSLGQLNRIPLLFESLQTPKVSIIIPFYNQEIDPRISSISIHKLLTKNILKFCQSTTTVYKITSLTTKYAPKFQREI